MIDPKIVELLNAHSSVELYSSNLYLAMSGYCGMKAFKGFARWLRVQSEEERDHAIRILDHVIARGGEPVIGAVEAPPREFGTITQVFESVAAHERRVTERVHKLYDKAIAEDSACAVFLQWFVAEQVEEEAAVVEILDRLRMVGDRPGAALYLDKEYGKRGKAGGS